MVLSILAPLYAQQLKALLMSCHNAITRTCMTVLNLDNQI